MEHIRRIQDLEHIKTLADARRLAILRLLMSSPATLSQLGHFLNEHPAQIRHHLKQLEAIGLVEMVETRVVRGFVEKYYRAKARAFVFHEIILPQGPEGEAILAIGSHDLALEALGRGLRQRKPNAVEFLILPVGSLEGLIALRQGTAQLAGCHLLDIESGEYNLPYVRHLFPDRETVLITLAHRQQGLLVKSGNPLNIHGLQDLAREDVVMINRNRGSGTRLWLDRQLAQIPISPQSVSGYTREVRTHTTVAEAISHGKADVGLGLQAAARQFGLDFIPIFEERFDLVLPKEQLTNTRLAPLFDYLHSAAYRKLVESLGGYDTAHTGDQLNP